MRRGLAREYAHGVVRPPGTGIPPSAADRQVQGRWEFSGVPWVAGTLESFYLVERRYFMAEDSRVQGLAWFMAGLGIGALVGILYAPKSGRETREDIAQGAREGSEFLRTKGKQAARQVGTLVERGKDQVGDYVDRGREVIDRGRAQWEEF